MQKISSLFLSLGGTKYAAQACAKKQVDGERSHIQYVASKLKHQRKKLEISLFKGGKKKRE